MKFDHPGLLYRRTVNKTEWQMSYSNKDFKKLCEETKHIQQALCYSRILNHIFNHIVHKIYEKVFICTTHNTNRNHWGATYYHLYIREAICS